MLATGVLAPVLTLARMSRPEEVPLPAFRAFLSISMAFAFVVNSVLFSLA